MRKQTSLLLAASAALSISTSMAHAVTFQVNTDNPDTLNMIGTIEYGDETKLQDIIAERNVAWIRLNSDGGNAYSGMMIAEIVRSQHIQVVVGYGDLCASACFSIFAAAQAGRFYHPTAHIGIHSATMVDDSGNPLAEGTQAQAATLESARYLTSVGTPPAIVTKLITTASTDLAWLKASDMTGWAIDFTDAPVQTAQPAPQPVQPTVQPQPTQIAPVAQSAYTMTCRSSAKRTNYNVTLGRNEIRVRDRIYPVTEQHSATKEAGAWVAEGPTKYGGYGAVFGGTNPRIAFVNTKNEVAIDQCW